MQDPPTTDRTVSNWPVMDRTQQTISDRAALECLLAGIIRRLRMRAWLGAFALGACWLLSALVVYQVALVLSAPPSLLEPLRWLLVIASLVALAWIAHGASVRPTTRDAASLADCAANLEDELKSAYYFSRMEPARPKAGGVGDDALHGRLVALLLIRAGTSAGRSDARRIVPGIVPRSTMPALALAAVAAALAWWSPPLSIAVRHAGDGLGATLSGKAFDNRDGADRRDSAAAAQPSAGGGDPAVMPDAKVPQRALTQEAEAEAEEVDGSQGRSDRGHRQAGAAAARDRPALTESARSPERESVARSSEDRSVAQVARPTRYRSGSADDPGSDEMPAARESLRTQLDRQGLDGDKSAENDLLRAMKAAEQRTADQGSQPAPPTRAGNPDNANSDRQRPQMREDGETQIGGQMEGNNPGGNSEVAEGSGQNVSLAAGADSRAPADAEHSKSPSDIAAGPVEGPKTTRLQAQLQRLRIDGQPGQDAENAGPREDLYAATRAQRSRIDYQAAASRPRQTSEAAITGERVPLAHRAMVKDYFLNLHGSDNE